MSKIHIGKHLIRFLFSFLIFFELSACAPQQPPEVAPAAAASSSASPPREAPIPPQADTALDLSVQCPAVLRSLIQDGADNASFLALRALADETAALADAMENGDDINGRVFAAPYVRQVESLLRLLAAARSGEGDFARNERRLYVILERMAKSRTLASRPQYFPVFDCTGESGALYALAACQMYALHRKEQNDGILSITTAGDTTFGEYPEIEKPLSFSAQFEACGRDLAFPLRLAAPFFKNDTFSILNCEGTFTQAEEMRQKLYRFKGPAEYAAMFVNGGIEIVNLANNHTLDYYEQGLQDTIRALDSYGVRHYGEKQYLIYEAQGVRFGFFGYELSGGGEPEQLADWMREDFKAVRELGAQAIIPTFHWGREYQRQPSAFQQQAARLAIDLGAEMVIGHHPHVVQGIEVYKGKAILYSLGNFAFGGDEDLKNNGDTMIVRQRFEKMPDGSLHALPPVVIPACISSSDSRNDYTPRPLFGADADRLCREIESLCRELPDGLAVLERLW